MEQVEWEKLSTADLVEELRYAGLSLPPELTEEIVARGQDAVPVLGGMASDASLWESDDPDEARAPLFALHLLGAIGDPSAAPFVLAALRLNPEPDEIIENTPTIMGHLGPQAITELARFILDENADGLMRGVACDGLASIGVLHPATRAPITAFLRRFVEEAAQHDPVAVTGAILSLVELRDRESLPAIGQAFRDRRVDETFLYFEDARDAMLSPETITQNWHYTGDPLDFLAPENLKKLREKNGHRRIPDG